MNIVVFEEQGSGQTKIRGIREHGHNMHIKAVITIDQALPDFIEEPEVYIDPIFDGDLVLDYLRHPDLSHYLITLCQDKGIPVIAPGKADNRALTPFTCCGLGRHPETGVYGVRFGLPRYRVRVEQGRICHIEVVRGAPCGATWDVLGIIAGATVEEALIHLGREVQYRCSANPAGFDPVTGKSPVHYAGHVHRAALKKAIQEAGNQ